MPGGDYLIHVHVQNGKNITLEGEQTVTAYVEAKCLSASQKTAPQEDITADSTVTFNEHLFLDLKKIEKEDAEDAVLQISIHNKGFFKGDLIGSIDISLSKIYGNENHVMLH